MEALFYFPHVTKINMDTLISQSSCALESCKDLEALPVHDGGAGLVVLLLGDPHLLER